MHLRGILLLILVPVFMNAQPAVKWRKSIKNGVQSINIAVALAVDRDGNVFTSSITHERDSVAKMLLIKLDSTGTEQWRRVYQSELNKDVASVALGVDAGGNSIVTGTERNKSGNTDIITLKYSPEGILLWENVYAGVANLYDAPSAMAIDKKGNVFVCGYETAAEANQDFLLIRYTASGEKSFVRNYASPQMDVAIDVVTDDSCNAYVCGNTRVSTRTGDILVMKFDSTGNTKWSYTYDGSQHAVDIATDIALDDSTSIYVTGSANHSNDRADVPLIRLNRNGKLLCDQVISEGVTDGIGSRLVPGRKSMLVQTTFTDYLQQTIVSSIQLADRTCNAKYKFTPGNEDNVYLKAFSWQNNSIILCGSYLSRPENTIAPYIEMRDSLHAAKYEYHDEVLISLLRIKDVLLTGRDLYFLGDDATENAGTVSIVKYSFPEEPKIKPKVANKKPK